MKILDDTIEPFIILIYIYTNIIQTEEIQYINFDKNSDLIHACLFEEDSVVSRNWKIKE